MNLIYALNGVVVSFVFLKFYLTYMKSRLPSALYRLLKLEQDWQVRECVSQPYEDCLHDDQSGDSVSSFKE